MSKYWRVAVDDEFFWVVDDDAGPYRVRNDQGRLLPLARGDDIPRQADPLRDIKSRFGAAADVTLSPLQPGQYHPRIFRPRNQPGTGKMYSHPWTDSVKAVRNILSRLEQVFQVIEPRKKNDRVFGHELRQLLILACTEVESSCKAIMKANGYAPPATAQWKTADYVKLVQPLHLAAWEIALTRSPRYRRFSPFQGWNSTTPTQSLPWYHAYNQTKHDREGHLADATLKHVIYAAGAAYLMVWAQFGQFGFRRLGLTEVDAFQVGKMPVYPLNEHYVPPGIAPGATWTPQHYTF